MSYTTPIIPSALLPNNFRCQKRLRKSASSSFPQPPSKCLKLVVRKPAPAPLLGVINALLQELFFLKKVFTANSLPLLISLLFKRLQYLILKSLQRISIFDPHLIPQALTFLPYKVHDGLLEIRGIVAVADDSSVFQIMVGPIAKSIIGYLPEGKLPGVPLFDIPFRHSLDRKQRFALGD